MSRKRGLRRRRREARSEHFEQMLAFDLARITYAARRRASDAAGVKDCIDSAVEMLVMAEDARREGRSEQAKLVRVEAMQVAGVFWPDAVVALMKRRDIGRYTEEEAAVRAEYNRYVGCGS